MVKIRAMKIIQKRERHEETTYARCFEYDDFPGAGFAFECDKDGVVDTSNFNQVKLANYNGCVAGKVNDSVVVVDRGVESRHHAWTDPAIGECVDCGDEVTLSGFTNTCEHCGADYNMSGQKLAPREQWGAETGESVSDILSVDYTDTDRLLGD